MKPHTEQAARDAIEDRALTTTDERTSDDRGALNAEEPVPS
jgi:hypothetical protein